MRIPRFEYVRAGSIEEGVEVLGRHGEKAKVLAGGTDLLVNMKYGVVRPEVVVSVKGIPELQGIAIKEQARIGSCVNLTDLAGNGPVGEKYPAFGEAVRSVASKHIRNMAMLGGNVCLDTRCWYFNQSRLWRDGRERCHKAGGSVCHAIKGSTRCHAINGSDTAPVLVALGGKIVVAKKGGSRTIPARDFYQDDGIRHTALEAGDLVTGVDLPDEGGRSTFIKVSMRKGLDFAVGNIAAWVKGNGKGLSGARLVIGSIASRPIFLERASKAVMDSGLTEKGIAEAAGIGRMELGTLTNLFSTAGYKRHLTEVLVKRALEELRSGKTGSR